MNLIINEFEIYILMNLIIKEIKIKLYSDCLVLKVALQNFPHFLKCQKM